ncbi:MAG: HEAT repeat domain-containing protein [Vicinamibacterales bacterium]
MRCEDAVVAIGTRLTGKLDADSERALQAHLRDCAACQAEAECQTDLWQRLGAIAVDPPDSPRMRQRLLVAIESFQTGADQAHVEWLEQASHRAPTHGGQHGLVPRSSRPPLAWLGVVAAALVVGVFVGRESRAVPAPASSADLVALRAELHDTRQIVTLALLRQSSAVERLRGVSWVERIDDPDAAVLAALIDTLAHDSNVNVRLAAIEALTRYGDRPGVRRGALAALTGTNASPLVQVALIDFLVNLKDAASRQILEQLAVDTDADEAVRARATSALQQLAG